jgi:hypothetical protein
MSAEAFDHLAFDADAFDCVFWDDATTDVEIWTAETLADRVFDPTIFALDPIYDTGTVAGIWTERTKQAEVWTLA